MMLGLLLAAQLITGQTVTRALGTTANGANAPIIHCAIDGTDEKWSEYNHTCHENPAERGPAPFLPEQSCLAVCTVIIKTNP
jgi:hypothetical protein